ncbi:hypothetical protein [sulfur-oxidizing endosymbiont of Gigantopelta aegis]|uniref:hypothetical protein n=1 Tax=sulfur-oxidizing endosymbiont of Gigantopelta aegis TaxID=2794934 RepID=UPI0018DC0E76|nr:hypothetical protein [sulfur-oxidizing endosymbiont of Gigantopelta aegis]
MILSQWFLIHPVFALQSQYASNANKIIILSKSAMSSAVPVDIPAIFNTRISQTSAEEILTITGEGFKQGPTVILYDNFSNGSDGEIIPLDSPHIGQWSSNLGSTHFEQYNSNEMGLAANNFKDWSSRPTLVTIFPQRTANLFLSYSVYMPPGATFSGASTPNTFPSISSWKFTWLTDGENGYYDREGKADLCVPSHAGRGSMIIGGNDGTLSYVSGGPVWWDFKQTNFISFYTKTDADAPQTENGTLFFKWLM